MLVAWIRTFPRFSSAQTSLENHLILEMTRDFVNDITFLCSRWQLDPLLLAPSLEHRDRQFVDLVRLIGLAHLFVADYITRLGGSFGDSLGSFAAFTRCC